MNSITSELVPKQTVFENEQYVIDKYLDNSTQKLKHNRMEIT